MSANFKAILITRDADKKQSVGITELSDDDLMEGDVTVSVEYTTVNYKDGLAITGKAPVVRRFPLVPGVDFAGTVIASSHRDFGVGDKVVLNGWGVGETHHGAFARRARVKGDWLVPLPDGLTARDAMAIGTAGYTAMLAVMALERHGIGPDRGPVIVTGAAGGVGSVAISLLSQARLPRHCLDRPAAGERLPEGAGRGRDHLARRAFGPGQAARQGALGRRRRRGRQPHAGQCAVHDLVWRRRRGVRAGARHGPSRQRRAVHPARRLAARHQFGDGAEDAAAGGMAAAGQPNSIMASSPRCRRRSASTTSSMRPRPSSKAASAAASSSKSSLRPAAKAADR